MNLEELRKRLKEINAELDDLLEQLEGEGLFTREGRVFHFAEDAFQIDEKSQEGL